MNPELLLSHFNRISDAPDAIPRLRRFILDLAVRGKLAVQDPTDEPAAELLKLIQAEKARLVEEGKIHREKPPSPASPDELAFELRPKWVAARISQILVELQTGPFGSSLHQSDYQRGGIPVINPASIKNERLVPIDSMAIGPATLERLRTFKLRAGDIVMARRGEMGRCAVVTEREDGWLCGTGSLILRLPECVFPRFFVTLIGSPFVREYLGGSAVGATMQNLNQSILLSLVVGLPPLLEQHRIVAKVDELMALCDRLEASQTELEGRRDTLAATSIHHLNNGASGEDFRRHANFYLGHLPHLTTRPAHIQQLRQTVLNLAVRGQLAPQDPTDEPASELFQRIQAWRKEAEGAKNVRAPRKSLQAVGETMPPYQLPDGWKWARLGELIYIHSGDGLTAETMNNGCIPVFGGNGITGYHDTPNIFQPSIVIGRVGYYCGSIHVTPAQAWVTDNAFITEFPSDQIVFDFLALLLRATNLKENEKATAQPVISGSKVYPIVVGLPPLIEQRRIVAKVDELMGICDRLEAQLTTGQAEGSRLLESVLHHALTCGDQIREEAQR